MANFQAGKPTIDYSVYLVTGRNYLPPGKTYLESLEEAIQGGVTLVQVREKDAETADTVALCRKHQVPVLINDRIDIALASNADGVHLGQEDMPIAVARKLLPSNAVIGKSCKSLEHVREAIKENVDYVGLGAVYTTNTKDVSAPGKVIGVKGLRPILAELEGAGMPAVAIGGLLINFGTVEDMDGMLAAGLNANLNRKPVTFDPVGVGATAYRQTCAAQLLNTWQPAVIKGNAAEIGAIVNSD
ncbi:hypothetical protein EWM64_g10557, partial [Hericium alpestre]